MQKKFGLAQTLLMALLLAICATSVSAGERELTPKAIDKSQIERPQGRSPATVSSVVNANKCPPRVPNGGPGNLVGGMCVYPKPAGGCGDLGSDCNEVYGEDKCRCSQKSGAVGGGGLRSPAQKQGTE
jgi:hypothetical protein